METDPTVPHAPAAEGFHRRLCESAPVALIATDADFRVVTCNAEAGRLLGASPAEVTGRPLAAVVPESRRVLLERLLARTAERGLTSELTLQVTDAAGGAMDLTIVLSPVPGPAGPAEGVAAWIIDETRRKRLAERLAQAEKLASLGTLAGGVAHHFNNILGGVATYVDFALGGNDRDAMRRALQMTADAAARASQITRSLLTFAEHGAGNPDLDDLTAIVLTFANLVERSLAERGIDLHLDLRPVPAVAVANQPMHRVLRNLLTNAEDAMPEGGTITLTLRREGDEALLTFADTGCGIKPEHRALVFEPFFTTKGLLSGGDRVNPGLGLSIVHGLVTEMGGHIETRTEPGCGATFRLRFPLGRRDK